MTNEIQISDIRFTAATPDLVANGLLGYVTLVLNDCVRLDGIALRRTADGRKTLSFPARRDRSGREHAYMRPISDAARRELEERIFAALGLGDRDP